MADPNDEGVGYQRPPVHTRWPKGVSGNPKGREKGHRGLKTDLEEALNTQTTIQNKLTGKMVKGRQQQHAVQRMVERAALGDLKAQALLFPMIMQMLGAEDRNKGPRSMSSQDRDILTEVLRSRLADAGEEPPAQADGDGNRLPPPPDAPPAEDFYDGEESGEEQTGDD